MRSRSGSTRSRGRGRSHGFAGRSQKRKLTWVFTSFIFEGINANGITTFLIIPSTDMSTTFLKGTVTQIYGELMMQLNDTATPESAYGAWGIRLCDEDAVPTTTLYSPFSDAQSTDWITQQGFQMRNRQADTTEFGANVYRIPFNIKNPRKTEPDQDLNLIVENNATSTSAITVAGWCRVGMLLA